MVDLHQLALVVAEAVLLQWRHHRESHTLAVAVVMAQAMVAVEVVVTVAATVVEVVTMATLHADMTRQDTPRLHMMRLAMVLAATMPRHLVMVVVVAMTPRLVMVLAVMTPRLAMVLVAMTPRLAMVAVVMTRQAMVAVVTMQRLLAMVAVVVMTRHPAMVVVVVVAAARTRLHLSLFDDC